MFNSLTKVKYLQVISKNNIDVFKIMAKKETRITILTDEKLHDKVGKIDRANVRAFNDYMREQAKYFAENETYLASLYKQKKADEKKQRKTSSTKKSTKSTATDTALFAE
jgi:hypothetical protein